MIIPDPDPYWPKSDLEVKVRSSGEVVYSLRLDTGAAANEGMSEIEADLEVLTLGDFCAKYGFPVPRSPAGRDAV